MAENAPGLNVLPPSLVTLGSWTQCEVHISQPSSNQVSSYGQVGTSGVCNLENGPLQEGPVLLPVS